jgi:hypothetical protein
MKDAEHRGRRQHHAPGRHSARRERDRAKDAALRDEPAVEQDEHQARVRNLVRQVDVVEVPQAEDVAAGQQPSPRATRMTGTLNRSSHTAARTTPRSSSGAMT